MHQMLLEQIRTVFDSGGLSGAKIVAGGKRFHVVVDTKAGGQVVLVRHSDNQPRFFSDPGTAIKLLHEIGFRLVTVDMSGWNVGQAGLAGC
jgi:hypothetical protein